MVAVLFRIGTGTVRRRSPPAKGATVVVVAVVPASATDEPSLSGQVLGASCAGVRRVPISHPFVGIADHVHATVGAGPARITPNRYALEPMQATGRRIGVMEVIALLWVPLIAPGKRVGIRTRPSRGLFPFGFGRQSPTGPFAVGFGLVVCDADYGMFVRLGKRVRPGVLNGGN